MPDSGSKNQKMKVSLIELENMMEKEDGGHGEVMCNILNIYTGQVENTMHKDQKNKINIEIVLNWKEWTETKQTKTRKFHLKQKGEKESAEGRSERKCTPPKKK